VGEGEDGISINVLLVSDEITYILQAGEGEAGISIDVQQGSDQITYWL
jgi:hypothetical protein